MTARKKVIRIMVVVTGVYIILNILVYGVMTAYKNTHNTLNEDKLTMAEVKDSGRHTSIKILGKEYSADINDDMENTALALLYCAASEKARACAEILTQAITFFD